MLGAVTVMVCSLGLNYYDEDKKQLQGLTQG